MAQVLTAVSPVKMIFGEQPWKCIPREICPLAKLCDGLHKASHGRLAVWNFVGRFPVKISAKIKQLSNLCFIPPEDKVQFVRTLFLTE